VIAIVDRGARPLSTAGVEIDPAPDLLDYLPWLGLLAIPVFIARAVRRGAAPRRSVKYLCSGCRQPVPAERIHLVPFFNAEDDNCGTAFRCEKCWLPSLEETRLRASDGTEGDRRKLVTFFERYGISGLSPEDVTGLLAILDDLRAGRRVLNLGSSRAIAEAPPRTP